MATRIGKQLRTTTLRAGQGETHSVGNNDNALDTLTQARIDHMNDLDIMGSGGGGRGGLGLGLSGRRGVSRRGRRLITGLH